MEPEVHQVLLWLYQENPWLHIICTLQMVIIFGGRRVNSNFEGKTHQILSRLSTKWLFGNSCTWVHDEQCCNRTSCAQVHDLPQSHRGNCEGTLFS